MDVAVMDVLYEHVGWKSATVARRYVGVTAAAAGVEKSRETVFTEKDALPLSEHLALSYTASRRGN